VVETGTEKIIYMNLGVLAKTGSVDEAIAKGLEATKQAYSGAWKEKAITGYFILSHDVTKARALTCQLPQQPGLPGTQEPGVFSGGGCPERGQPLSCCSLRSRRNWRS
jgi:hypothetical protein